MLSNLSKIDWKFVAVPIPLLLICLYMFVATPRLGDFQAHLAYEGDSGYPPALAWYLDFLFFLPREAALFLVSMFFAVYLPYVLVFEITRNKTASWLYIYASGIPFMLAAIWFVPQAIVQSFMLLSVWRLPFLLIFLLLGWSIHTSWWAAWILTAGFIIYKRLKK